MTDEERRILSEQLLSNPLLDLLLSEIEQSAVEALIYAKTEQERVETQWRVRSVRTFRQDCEAALRNNLPRKGAIA